MVVTAGDERGTRWRAQRSGVEVGVAQAVRRDPVEGGCGDDATEGTGDAEAGIVRHDQQDIWSAFGRHDTRRPVGRRIRRVAPDPTAELLWLRWKLLAINRRGGTRRAWSASHLLRASGTG